MSNKVSILNEAIKRTDFQKIKEILNDPDVSSFINIEDPSKYTPIFFACMSPDQKFGRQVCQLLIERGANPLHYDINVQSVLYYLAKDGKIQLLKYLFPRYDFDINHNDYVKQTPLFFAACQNHKQCAQYLLRHKADVNHIDNNGQNCIFYAASYGHLDMCKLLVNRGANFQLIDHNRETPINYARKKKHRPIMEYFNGLRNRMKQQEVMSKVQSSHQSKEPRRKKQLQKNEYCLIFTNEKGQTRELTLEQLERFGAECQDNKKILQLIRNPEGLDMMSFPEQKKFEKMALKILIHFTKHQQGIHFAQPLDIVALNIPHYPNIVKTPMDFSTIKTKLTYNAYDSESDFYADMNLVFDNCILFNGKDSAYGKVATQLKLEFNTMYRKQFGL